MTQKPNCQKITSAISTIKSKRALFKDKFAENDIEASIKLINEIKATTKEIEDSVWSLEILTKENIEKQYDEWEEMYRNFNPEYKFPDKENIFEFLSKDRSFMELMETKEKQGLTKLIIAPAPGFFSLKSLADFVERKVQERGGSKNHYFGAWLRMLGRENDIRYFGRIKVTEEVPTDGIAAREIKESPDKYGVCDGWIICFTTGEQNIARYIANVTGGRKAIETNKNAAEFQETYFSNSNPMYEGEESMIPQEHLAVFAKDFFEKYVKVNRKLFSDIDADLIDSDGDTWFISTYLNDGNTLPTARWSSTLRYYGCGSYSSENLNDRLGVRSVVRRNIKS